VGLGGGPGGCGGRRARRKALGEAGGGRGRVRVSPADVKRRQNEREGGQERRWWGRLREGERAYCDRGVMQ
jgi:hypothetical protein